MKTKFYVKGTLLWLCNNALAFCMTEEFASLLKEPSWRAVIGFAIYGFLWPFTGSAIIMAIAGLAKGNKIEKFTNTIN